MPFSLKSLTQSDGDSRPAGYEFQSNLHRPSANVKCRLVPATFSTTFVTPVREGTFADPWFALVVWQHLVKTYARSIIAQTLRVPDPQISALSAILVGDDKSVPRSAELLPIVPVATLRSPAGSRHKPNLPLTLKRVRV